MRYYLSIDVTNPVDAVVWGHLWHATFGWRNLLWELDKDVSNDQRRVDKAHPNLPIARVCCKRIDNKHFSCEIKTTGSRKSCDFADTCVMPQGMDAKGKDPLWPGPDAFSNRAEINAACAFMQTLILNPRVERATSALKDSGASVVADVVYVSSHGTSDGNMFGEVDFAERIFSPARLAASGTRFSGLGWLVLSNCNTLKPCTHRDWINLMNGPLPLRGVIGFQGRAPLAEPSAGISAGVIRRLAEGKTLVRAWEETLIARGLAERWAVLCHEEAAGDTIAAWNADKLKPIRSPSKILLFNKDHRTGVEAKPVPDPFEAFWSKGGTRISGLNREDPANLLAAGDTVVITVEPTPPAVAFADGVTISITLTYIRPDYPARIDVTTMFTVTGQSGASTPATANLNALSRGLDDSWQLTTTGTPSEVTLTLRCDDLSELPYVYLPLWLRVNNGTTTHDFTCGGILVG